MNKKTGLINTYSTFNIGDSAIYSSIAILSPNKPVYGAIQDKEPLYTPGFAPVTELSDCDVYISVGGDIFNNSRPYFITKTFLKNLQMLNKNPQKTMLFGQSIPASCRFFSFKLLAQQLKKIAAVVVRDEISHQRLRNAGVDCRLSYDLAFSLSGSNLAIKLAKETYEQAGIDNNKTVLISLRQFDAMYPHDNDIFIDKLVKLCSLLKKYGKQPAILVQSNAYGTDGDWYMAKKIQELSQISIPVINAFTNNTEVANWDHLIALLDLANLVVGVRYHTSILRMVSGKMPYNLYYSIKGQDLSKRLGVPGVSVADFDPDTALPEILATEDQDFFITEVRKQVKNDFDWAYNLSLKA